MNKCTVVAKRELFFAWPFGIAAWLCGLIFINRMHSDESRIKLRKASAYIKSKQIKLWIFPEGTRRNTGSIHAFKKGAFHMAIDAQIPILPVVFSSYRSFLDDKNKNFNCGRVIITTLPPISTVGMSKYDVNTLLEHTYDVMNKEFHLTTNEINEQAKLKQSLSRKNGVPSAATVTSTSVATTNVSNINQHCVVDEDNVFNQYTFMHHHRTTTAPTAN